MLTSGTTRKCRHGRHSDPRVRPGRRIAPAERLDPARTPTCTPGIVDRDGAEKSSVRRPARAPAAPLAPRPAPLGDIPALPAGAGSTGAIALHVQRSPIGLPHGHVLNEPQELASYDGAAELERGLDVLRSGPLPEHPDPPRRGRHRKEQHRLRPAEHRTTRGEQERRSS